MYAYILFTLPLPTRIMGSPWRQQDLVQIFRAFPNIEYFQKGQWTVFASEKAQFALQLS